MKNTIISLVAALAITHPATAQTKPPVASGSGQKHCSASSADFGGLSAEFDVTAKNIAAALSAAGCKQGDIISLHSFRVSSVAAARLCDFTQTVYSDNATIVCRWVGGVRPMLEAKAGK